MTNGCVFSNFHERFFRRTCFTFMVSTLLGAQGLYADPTQKSAAVNHRYSTLVIRNARVWSAGMADRVEQQKLRSILIDGQRITMLSDNQAALRAVGPDTQVVDAGGRRVIPGITDSHTHIISGGLQMSRLALRNVRNKEDFVHAIVEAAKTKKPGEWLLGGRWSVESWTTAESPDRSWIDPATADTPVFLSRMDGHQALANSAALKTAGIDASGPPDPTGGEIVRDPRTGEPTGILKESAMGLVSQHIPEATTEARYEALRRAMAHANSLGVTSVHDMSDPDDLETFRVADADGAMTVRVTSYLSVSDWPTFADRVATYPHQSDMFRLVGFKGYMDGSLGSRTAYMRERYSDATKETMYPRGQLTAMAESPEAFGGLVELVDGKGLQIAVHAIGDEANHLLLNAYESALRKNGRRNARHRIEHAQHLLLEDIPRFARLGVVASMQPYHKADDGRYAERALCAERLKGSYAFRRLLDAGALLCFGSDWPVVSLNPFDGIASAVNATTLTGEVWLPSHSISLEEALDAYTLSPARAVLRDDQLGTIREGKLADLVILEDDPFALPATRLADTRVAMTIVAGRVVYSNMK